MPVSGYPLNGRSFCADFSRRVGTESLDIKPERFGRYVLLDRVGVGGMAEVFRAVMPGAQGFQRTFVVKRILGERAQSPYFVDMFVREARINAVLHHPNIVQVFDFGEVGGTYFLAMEYVRGRDVSAIARRLRHRARPVRSASPRSSRTRWPRRSGYAHALTSPDGTPLNVVHRDVSPSNIICQRAGGVKLLDFGIAQALTEPEAEKTQRMFKGKIAYVAPERIKGQPADSRADLFSLGVVLWELLAGRKLFRGKTEVETLQNVVEMPVPALSSLRADVPAELEEIVARALARDPAERYATAYELAEELEAVLAALRYQPRAMPALLHELFGAELSSRQIPAATLTPELLAAGTTTSATPSPSTAASAERRHGGAARAAVALAVVGRCGRRDRHADGAAVRARRRPAHPGDGTAAGQLHRPRVHPGGDAASAASERDAPAGGARGRGEQAGAAQARAPRAIGRPGSNRARPFNQPVRRGRVAARSMIATRSVAIAVVVALFAGLHPAAAETRNRGRHRSAAALCRRRGRLQGRALRRSAGRSIRWGTTPSRCRGSWSTSRNASDGWVT